MLTANQKGSCDALSLYFSVLTSPSDLGPSWQILCFQPLVSHCYVPKGCELEVRCVLHSQVKAFNFQVNRLICLKTICVLYPGPPQLAPSPLKDNQSSSLG